MFTLKDYQTRALAALSHFLNEAKGGTVAEAFKASYLKQELDPVLYRHYDFGEMPYICMRLPTGGGKTVLASYAVSVAQKPIWNRIIRWCYGWCRPIPSASKPWKR